MKEKNPSEVTIFKKCLSLLENIEHVSQTIAAEIEKGDFKKIESLFHERGRDIEALASLEQQLEQTLHERTDTDTDIPLRTYVGRRNTLLEIIHSIDSRTSAGINESKNAVLSEIKELRRGKKMNKGYLDSATFSSGFIDVKE